MARGFGPTLGVNVTDVIQTSLTAHATQRTWFLIYYQNGAGGSSIGRLFEKIVPGGNRSEAFQVNESNGTLSFVRAWGDQLNPAVWTVPKPSTAAWHSLSITYDAGSTANDPAIQVDNTPQTVTETVAPAGSLFTDAGSYYLGNRPAADRNLDGMMGLFAVWNRIVRLGELVGLHQGWPPGSIHGLVEYIPMVRENRAMTGPLTITGTAIQPNPSKWRPWTTVTKWRRLGTLVSGGPVGSLTATLAALTQVATGTVVAGGGGPGAPKLHYYLAGIGAR